MRPVPEFQQVTEGVFFWGGYDARVKSELTASAVCAAEGLVFIDPIPLAAPALEELAAQGKPAAVVVTSGNHWRAADEYRRRFSVPLLASAGAWQEGDPVPDATVRAGEVLAGSLQVWEVPGAGPGEIALCQPGGSLHIGDAVIHVEPYGFALLPEKYCTDGRAMREALQKLLHADFRLILLAHGMPLTVEAPARLAKLLA